MMTKINIYVKIFRLKLHLLPRLKSKFAQESVIKQINHVKGRRIVQILNLNISQRWNKINLKMDHKMKVIVKIIHLNPNIYRTNKFVKNMLAIGMVNHVAKIVDLLLPNLGAL